MRNDLTELVLVVDRSGSMHACRTDAEGGINAFLDEQKKLPGDAYLTLVQFDNVYEFVHTAMPIRQVPTFRLYPRGGTALLDAVGRAINETGERLSKMAESDRPGLVVVVIVTDGLENASREFTKPAVKAMIEHQSAAYKWQFTYLAANVDAFAEAGALGIARAATGQSTNRTSGQTYSAASANVGRMRKSAIEGQAVTCEYTAGELRAMSGT